MLHIIEYIMVVWGIVGVMVFHETLSFTDMYNSDGSLKGLLTAIVLSGPIAWFLTIMVFLMVLISERRVIKLFTFKSLRGDS